MVTPLQKGMKCSLQNTLNLMGFKCINYMTYI